MAKNVTRFSIQPNINVPQRVKQVDSSLKLVYQHK